MSEQQGCKHTGGEALQTRRTHLYVGLIQALSGGGCGRGGAGEELHGEGRRGSWTVFRLGGTYGWRGVNTAPDHKRTPFLLTGLGPALAEAVADAEAEVAGAGSAACVVASA